MRPRLMVPVILAAGLLAAPPAQAAGVLGRLYAPLHIHPSSAPSPSYVRSHFDTITVQPKMLGKYTARHVGLYTKGTRSATASFPESWYLHSAGGGRVHDRTRPGFFVMNPASAGWRRHVAQTCRPSPSFCFLDAMGTDGYTRTNVRPSVSLSWWVAQTTGLANYVENASTRYRVVANNLITARNPKFRVAYEMFGRTSAARSLDILRHTQCLCFAKFATTQSARYGFTLFLVGAGKGDRISVGSDAQAGKWWSFFTTAKGLGSAVAKATVNGNIISRRYKHGMVVVNTGGTAQSFAQSGSSRTLAARDGMIIIN
jgi:hypothetical protein